MEQVGKGMTRFKMAEEEKSLACLLKHMGIMGLGRASKSGVLNNIFDLNIVCVGYVQMPRKPEDIGSLGVRVLGVAAEDQT